jgi:hypothetical protein
MATTFKRIQTLIQKANIKNKWETIDELSEYIRGEKIKDFQTKKGKSTDIENFMKIGTIIKLIRFSEELELMERDPSGEIKLTLQGKKALKSDDNFKSQIKSSVKSLLVDRNAPLNIIIATAKKIQPPEYPDASSIFNNLPSGTDVSEKELRSILFLYALAEGIERKTKVMYISN